MVDKLPFLSDDHHYAIAAVAARSAQLDTQIETTIAHIIAGSVMERTSEFILKNMNGDKYVGLLNSLLIDLYLGDEEKQALIKKVFERVKDLRTQRNEILHWICGKSDDPTHSKHVSIRPHRETREKTLTAQEILAVAKEMLDLVLVIAALGSLSPKPIPSLDKHAQQAHPRNLAWQQILDRYGRGEPLQPQLNS
jgi:hypothetical protein